MGCCEKRPQEEPETNIVEILIRFYMITRTIVKNKILIVIQLYQNINENIIMKDQMKVILKMRMKIRMKMGMSIKLKSEGI